jgi:hypothetical protein
MPQVDLFCRNTLGSWPFSNIERRLHSNESASDTLHELCLSYVPRTLDSMSIDKLRAQCKASVILLIGNMSLGDNGDV